MTPMYRVWSEDDYADAGTFACAYEVHATPGPGRGWWEVARDAENAAEIWANEQWSNHDHPKEMDCVVSAPDGTVTRWKVEAEHTVVFNASPKEED